MVCPPSNVIGPFIQTKFLGASIVRYTSKIGWNGDTGSLEVTLAEDLCAGTTKLYYDACGQAQTTTEVDSFNPPVLGTPVYFRYGDLEFGGILKSWERDKSTSGTLYYVTITDPTQILDGTQVILSNYTGSVMGVPNLLNPYGYLENIGANCTTVTTGMNPALGYVAPIGFGNVNENDAGIQWNQLRSTLITLINSTPTVYGSRLQLRSYNFFLDLTEVPILDEYFRISGDSTSLLDIISQVCQAGGYDFFTELVYVTGLPGQDPCATDSDTDGHLDPNGIAAFIKIRAVSGYSASPSSLAGYIVDGGVDTAISTRIANGAIGDFVLDVENDDESGAKQHRSGVELRESITNAFLVGDNRQDLWQIAQTDPLEEDGSDNIWPYWGVNDNNEPFVSTGIDLDHVVNLPQAYIENWGISANATTLHDEIGVGGYDLKVIELCAAMDSFSSWLAYIAVDKETPFENLGGFGEINAGKFNPADFVGAAIAADGKVKPQDLIALGKNWGANIAAWAKDNTKMDPIRSWYGYIKSFADEFFGKKFLVKMPFTCSAFDSNQPFTLKLNWGKSDAAWTDAIVLGFANNSPAIEFFRGPDGRIQCFLSFDGDVDTIDYSTAPIDDIWFIDDKKCLIRANFEQIIYMDPANQSDPRAVISIQNPITTRSNLPDIPLHAALLVTLLVEKGHVEADAVNDAKKLLNKFGVDVAHHGLYSVPMIPNAAAVPLRSNTLSYGPWISTLAAGPASKTDYKKDSSFSPWAFGATALMNGAGAITVESQVTNIVALETGSLSVPGSPITSLGRLLIAGGPTVTSIDTSVSIEDVSTTYRMRTWTPQFGDIGRQRVEALRKAGNMQQQIQRALTRSFSGRNNEGKPVDIAKAWRKELVRPDAFNRQTSHGWLGSETMVDHQNVNFRRDFGAITDFKKALPTLGADNNDEYLKKAGCEFVGVFRGFSTHTGDSNWSKYETPVDTGSGPDLNTESFFSKYQVPPVLGEHHTPITVRTLNPFVDPSGGVLGSLHDGNQGHDIDYIIRDGAYPTELNIQDDGYSQNEWYRTIGLRAPLVLVGWGYDTNNKPVPNAGDDEMKFATDWLKKPHLWKAGPLDVRWDNDRKVWTSPSPFKIVKVRLLEHINGGGSTSGIMWNESIQKNKDGNNVNTITECGQTGQVVEVQDHGIYPKLKGSDVMCCYNNGQYDILTDRQHTIHGRTSECVSPGATGLASIIDYSGLEVSCDAPDLIINNKLNQPFGNNQDFFGFIKSVSKEANSAEVWVTQAQFQSICVVTEVDCVDDEIIVCDKTIYVQTPTIGPDCGSAELSEVTGSGNGGCPGTGDFNC